MSTDLERVLDRLRKFKDDRNLASYLTPKNICASVSIEAGELLEHFQWREDGYRPSDEALAAVAHEASDVLLYTLMLFDELGLDPLEEATRKIAMNESRYPLGGEYSSADDIVEFRRTARRSGRTEKA